MQYHELIAQLLKYSSSDQPVYVVGGAVRDLILSRQINDFDIVVAGNARQLARRFADEHGGAFYVLDECHKSFRVLLGSHKQKKVIVDFNDMRGMSITDDLELRDFTINAIAMDPADPEKFIDPKKGGKDLQQKRLRLVSSTSLLDDPLRTIRAVRYAVSLGLKIESETTKKIKDAVPGLTTVSAERKRDELFKILANENVSTSLQLILHFQIAKYFPLEINPDSEEAIRSARVLEEVIAWLTGRRSIEKQAAFYQVSLCLELGCFKEKLKSHFLERNSAGRVHEALLQLALLLVSVSSDQLTKNLKSLTLSVFENDYIRNFERNLVLIEDLMKSRSTLTPLEIHDFFTTSGNAGIDLVITSLAKYCSRIGSEFSQENWLERLKLSKLMLDVWFERPELIRPIPLLNGDDIIASFQMKPGPFIGELLEGLKRAQVMGQVNTRLEASEWIARKLATRK